MTVFPHVIASLGEYLSREAGLAPGTPMAYLVAPPIEATIGLDAALKAAERARGEGHDAADRDELRVRLADRHARRVRGRGGRVRRGRRRCRRGAEAMSQKDDQRDHELRGLVELNPTDVDAILVYADWLEERGDLPRATFLRLQQQLRGMRVSHPKLLERGRALFDLGKTLPADWVAAVTHPKLREHGVGRPRR